jgi:hypothetical protein
MPIELNEDDIAVVLKIQEAKNTTISRAKEYYRLQAKRLANPDIKNRAEIILENFNRNRNGKQTSDVFAEKTVKKTKKGAKTSGAASKSAPEPELEVALPELEREVELRPVTDHKRVYSALLFGKRTVVVMGEIDHGNGAADRFGYVGISEKKLTEAKRYARENEMPVAVCAIVRVKGRLDQGYAVPLNLFEKFALKSKHALTLGKEARAAYAEDGWAGVKFVEIKGEEKAA